MRGRLSPSARRRWRLATLLLLGLLFVPVLGAWSVVQDTQEWMSRIDIRALAEEPLPQHSKILAGDGTVIATFYAENRLPVAGADIPKVVREAILATEDARYYEHGGIDIQSTLHAIWSQVTNSGTGGGSGITQQYVKNLLITHARTETERRAATEITLQRKIREARAAYALEAAMSKEDILVGYLNTVYFGDNAYGIGAAARHFFNKTPKQLSLAEAALIAGLVQNPSGYDPTNHPQAAKTKRAHVLARMRTVGYITAAQERAAKAEPIALHITTVANGCMKSEYPMYCQWIRNILASDPAFGATDLERQAFLYTGGLTIHTALDRQITDTAVAAAQEALPPLTNTVATAIAVVQPGTGHVVAIASNRPWGSGPGQTEIVLPAKEAFQPGSTFKVITAAAAIELGVSPNIAFSVGSRYTPARRNSPPGGFRNDENGSGGYLDMAAALRRSVNTWFVALEDQIGVRITARTGVSLGMTSLPLKRIGERDAALTLGAYETSPIQLAQVYATLAAHGRACPPVGITAIERTDGTDVSIPNTACRQAIRPSTADALTSMLTGVIKTGTGTRAALPNGRPAAGKTGTTTNSAACWFAGYTPQYATTVWIGDPRGGFKYPLKNLRALGRVWEPVYGGGVPALIWKSIMSSIHESLPVEPFTIPGGDAYTGASTVIPDVRGLPIENALSILSAAGLKATVRHDAAVTDQLPADRVASTSPAPGTPLFARLSRSIVVHST